MSKKLKAARVETDGTNALAVLNNAAAQERAAFVVMGGEMYTPAAYRGTLERAWTQSLSGVVSKSIRAEAYGISAAAYAATNYRAQVLSDTPVNVFNKGGGVSDWNPVPYFLTSLPTLSWFIEATLIIYGVCYLRKVYNDYGYPSGLEWIHPDDVIPQTDVKGRVEEYYIDAVRYMPFQMVEIRTFDPQRTLDGKSEFEVALSRMTTEQSIVRHAGSFFFNSARPDGMLLSKSKLGKADQIKAEQDWKKFKGSKNAWKTFVSSGQWEWIPLTGAPVDLAMVDLGTKNDRDILAIMRVNPALLGFADVSDPLSAGSTMREIKKNHIEDVTIPRYNWILRHLNEQWLYPDFGHGDLYQLGVDRAKMPILSEVNLDRAQTSTTLTGGTGVVMDYNETRNFMGLPDRDGYFSRNPIEVNTVWGNTGLTLDEYREMLGLKPFGAFGGDLVKLTTGQLVRLTDLPAAAAAMLQQLVQQSLPPPPPLPPASNAPQFIMPPGGFGGFGGGGNVITPPAPQPPPALQSGAASKTDLTKLARLVMQSKRSGGATNEAAVLLSFTGNRQIQAVQTILTAYSNPDAPPPEYTPPDDYHITLIMAESLTPAAEQRCYETLANLPAVELLTGEIGSFPADEDGKTPVVLFLKENDGLKTLREYQAQLYAQIMETEPGAVLSDYSLPEKWNPHITLCYAVGEHILPDLKAPLPIVPTSIEFSRKVYEITYQAPTAPNGSEQSPPVELAAEPTQRAASSVELAVLWPENNFILMAQRVAANALQSAGITGVEWYPTHNWRMRLGSFSGSPGQANQVLNHFQPGDNAKVDLTAYTFQIVGRSIYLMCDPAEALSKLSASVNLQLEDSGIRTDESPFVAGIPLGDLTDTTDPNAMMDIYNALMGEADKLGMQLVAGNVDLIVNGQSRSSWELRTHTVRHKQELNNWKQKSIGINRKESGSFKTSALSGSIVESFVRAALAETDPDDLGAIVDIFSRAQRILTDGVNYLDLPDSPDEYESYWNKFDSLTHDLGKGWLGYMDKAADSVAAMLATDTNPTSIYEPLNQYHDGLVDEWVGTPDEPGDLVKIVLAGMAAGNEALKGAVSMNPSGRAFGSGSGNFNYTPPPQFKGVGVTVDWNLLNQQAYDFARQYSYKLIKGLDQTTQTLVQTAFTDWLKSGAGQPALKEAIRQIFSDKTRADAIAETESIRIYNEGAFKRWSDVGVTKAVWRTVQDPRVCPICRPLNGQIADINAGWIHPGGSYIDPYDNQRVDGTRYRGKVYTASAHVRCRCYRRPVVIYEKPTVPKIDPQTETVSKTRFSGQRVDEILRTLDSEYADIRASFQKKLDRSAPLRGQIDELNATRKEMSNRIFALSKEYQALPTDSPEYLDKRAAHIALYNEYDKINENLRTAQKNLEKQRAKDRKEVLKELSTPAAFRNTPEPYQTSVKKFKPSAAMMKKAEESANFLSSVLDGDQYTTEVSYKVFRRPGRASYGGGLLNMSPDNDVSVYVHETGHFIEEKFPDVHERCVEFLTHRAAGEAPKKMSELTGNKAYRSDEIAIKDNFEEPYIGKVYKNAKGEQYATEVLSMGLQYMYEDAIAFSIRDPEYFNFILGIMRRAT